MADKDVKIISDIDLYLLIKGKNKSGFDYMYSRYSCIFYGVALNTVKSKECAKEIVEHAFLKSWESIDLFINQKISMNVWMIRNLTEVIKEYLSSKNMKYSLKPSSLPCFHVSANEENPESFASVDANNLSLKML